MAYDDLLAARVRRTFSDRHDVVEKPMFGGLTFMVAGNMCCGVNDAGTALEDLHSAHIRAWDLMKRPMRGIVAVTTAGCARQETVDHWVTLALTHALSLPPKAMRAARTRRARAH